MQLSRLFPLSAIALMAAVPIALAVPMPASEYYRPLGGQGDQATRALNILEAQGYRVFRDFQRMGNRYDVTATRNDSVVHVQVDPSTDTVTPIG